MQGPFLLCLCQRGVFTAFQIIFLFRCSFEPEAESRVWPLAHKWNKPSCTAGKPGRMILSVRPDTLGQTYKIILPCRWFTRFHASGYVPFPFWRFPFFTDFSFEVFLSNLPPLPFTSIFAPFSEDASDGHSRSGCKGNFGIVRKSKVKPPVFGKNLQPFG